MKLLRTIHFVRNYSKAPKEVQRAFDKQSLILLQNLHHPSLRAKKYSEANNPMASEGEPGLAFLLRNPGRRLYRHEHHSAPEVK